MGLLETMKQVAQATNDAGMPTAFLFGSVTKTSPLTIRVDNRFDISGDAIVVMKEFQAGFYPTQYHTGVKGSPSTEEKSGGSGDASFASHTHKVKISPWLPSPGDYVLCLYIPTNDGDGFVIGGI